MLVLTRKPGEEIIIGDGKVKVLIAAVSGGRVKICVDAPGLKIVRTGPDDRKPSDSTIIRKEQLCKMQRDDQRDERVVQPPADRQED